MNVNEIKNELMTGNKVTFRIKGWNSEFDVFTMIGLSYERLSSTTDNFNIESLDWNYTPIDGPTLAVGGSDKVIGSINKWLNMQKALKNISQGVKL